MDLSKYFTFVIMSCSFSSYAEDITETPFMSTKYIGNGDSFSMMCNASSFFNPSIYDWYIINRFKMYRKLDSSDKDKLIGVIGATKPEKPEPLVKNVPPGRQWEYEYGELYTYNMYITVIVKDATLADVGNYWCEAEIDGMDAKLNSSSFNLRPKSDEPVQIINKKEIGNNDTFTIKCNITSFRDSNLPTLNTVFRLHIMRQIEGNKEDEYVGWVESFVPTGYDNVANKAPEGRNWVFSTGGYNRRNNRDVIFITVTFKDATCQDAGYYWCAVNFVGTSYRYFSHKVKLHPKVTNVVKMNPIKVTPQKSGPFNTSHNNVGDNVTIECTYTGWRRMIAICSLNRIYLQHNLNTKDFPPELANKSKHDGCRAYSHRSTKTIVPNRSLTDPIFFCRAISSKGGETRVFASMQIFIHTEKAPQQSKSHATPQVFGNKVFQLLFLYMLVICFNSLL